MRIFPLLFSCSHTPVVTTYMYLPFMKYTLFCFILKIDKPLLNTGKCDVKGLIRLFWYQRIQINCCFKPYALVLSSPDSTSIVSLYFSFALFDFGFDFSCVGSHKHGFFLPIFLDHKSSVDYYRANQLYYNVYVRIFIQLDVYMQRSHFSTCFAVMFNISCNKSCYFCFYTC